MSISGLSPEGDGRNKVPVGGEPNGDGILSSTSLPVGFVTLTSRLDADDILGRLEICTEDKEEGTAVKCKDQQDNLKRS